MSSARPSRRSGFTLIEVAVTLAIVAIGLTLCLQSLFTSKATAAQTRNLKLARTNEALNLLAYGEALTNLVLATNTEEEE